MKRQVNFTISTFVCTKCNNKQFLPRKMNRPREYEHRKKIYCVKCLKRVNHVEYREFDFVSTMK